MKHARFKVTGLPVQDFEQLFGLDDPALAERGVVAYVADEKPGFPCRVSLADAEVGERVLLLNYEHQTAPTPYRARHAIFVRDHAREAQPQAGEIPAVLSQRLLSVRAFDANHMMRDADVIEGHAAAATFKRFLNDADVAYLHVHNAKRGCYAARRPL